MNQHRNTYILSSARASTNHRPHLLKQLLPNNIYYMSPELLSGQCLLTKHYNYGRAIKTAFEKPFLPSLPENIKRPILINFKEGRITVASKRNTMKARDISLHIRRLQINDPCSENTNLLALPQFRMVFQNMLEEQDSCTVSYTMAPMKKEIDRMFFRIIVHQKKEKPRPKLHLVIDDIRTYDMPYRSTRWVKNLYISCRNIIFRKHSTELRQYLNHILCTESVQVNIELEYNTRQKRCENRHLDFGGVIDLFQCEEIGPIYYFHFS